MNRMHNTLVDNTAESRYELPLDDDVAVIEYIRQPGYVILTHTGVPPQHEGQGIGKALVEAVLHDLREKSLKVVPQCTFVAKYIVRHPEWETIVLRERE